MKVYYCPDCGLTIHEQNPTCCPECGCQAAYLIAKEQEPDPVNSINNQSTMIDNSTHAKVYYSDNMCVIGDKVWEFSGYDGLGNSGQVFFSVRNIVSVGLHKPDKWSSGEKVLIVIGIITSILIIGLILIIYALVKHHRRRELMVLTTHPDSSFTFNDVTNIQEAKKYMIPMRQCLLEN